MLIKRVVINASPLIVLFKSQQADLLPQLFSEIFVPAGVWDEITVTSQKDAASQQLSSVTWAQRVEIGEIPPEVAAWDLGKGESEVLSLALKDSNLAAIIDDRAARRCSQALSRACCTKPKPLASNA
jgi:predicted nucleic acid-binding protein